MRLVVTGAGGFLGRAMAARLTGPASPLAFDSLVLTDLQLPFAGTGNARTIEGDLADPAVRASVLEGGVDVLIHLAALPSGATESDPLLARRLNLDASIALFQDTAAAGDKPRIVHASSIAALGQLKAPVDDDTPLRPTLTYGALKVMLEMWLCDMSRRGSVEGLALRLPGLVARPLVRTGQQSAFLSDIFHHMRAGEPFTVPVRPEATSWLMSVGRCVDNFLHAAAAPASALPAWRAITLPALRARIGDVIAELSAQTGNDAGLASFAPEPALEAIFASYPPLSTPAADAMGLRHDGSVADLVRNVLADLDRPGR